jgi:sporulation protein YlmC with PRC-barrel domain
MDKGGNTMISTQDLRNKEVINIYDGKSLGYVYDIEVNLEKGIIEGLIVPEQ